MRTNLLSALLLLSGCNQIFFVEASTSAICKHFPNEEFGFDDATIAQLSQMPASQIPAMEVTKPYVLDVGSLELPAELGDAEKKAVLTGIRLEVSDPAKNFGSIDAAKIVVAPPPGSALEPHVLTYTRTEAAPKEIVLPGGDLDLTPFMNEQSVHYTVTILGRFASERVVADVDACAAASVRLNYLK
jgi:hypothetical protein